MKKILYIALFLLFAVQMPMAQASRTNRIYRPCPTSGGLFPTIPAQVSIDSDGDVLIAPCYQKTFTINDPHSPSTDGIFWSSLTGTEIEGSLNIYSSDFKVYGSFQIGATDATYTTADFNIVRTITAAGTTGNVTINKLSGTVNIAAGAGTAGVTVTNSTVTANSIVYAIARTNDATCSVKSVVPASGSFVLRTTANCTAETSFGFLVTN